MIKSSSSTKTKTASKKWQTKIKKNYVGIVAVLGALAIFSVGVSVPLEQAYAIFPEDHSFHTDCYQMTRTGSCIHFDYPVLTIGQPFSITA